MDYPPEPEIPWRQELVDALQNLRPNERATIAEAPRANRRLTRADKLRELDFRYAFLDDLFKKACANMRHQERLLLALLAVPAVRAQLKAQGIEIEDRDGTSTSPDDT